MPIDVHAVTVPFRMQPGLRLLPDGTRQLTPCSLGARALAEKLQALTRHPERALLAVPGFDAAAVLRSLCEQASAEHPAVWGWDGARHWQAHTLGWSVRDTRVVGDGPPAIGQCLQALAPEWRAAALLALAFEEDFAVIDGVDATVPWLAVCLPSHWAPERKLGLHFAQIHAPVADNAMLIQASEHLARLVTAGQRWERFVWTVTPRAALRVHPLESDAHPWPAAADPQALIAQAHWRTERQTFIPCAARRAVFTIHVQTQPLRDAVVTAEQAQRVHAALSSMSAAVLDYRGLTPALPALLDWLAVWPGGAPGHTAAGAATPA